MQIFNFLFRSIIACSDDFPMMTESITKMKHYNFMKIDSIDIKTFKYVFFQCREYNSKLLIVLCLMLSETYNL